MTGAYCPHLGANLCAGGRVEKDCITCPFHGWSFSGKSGHCESVPYSKASIPKNAALKKFICQEQNGLIYVWHDKQGKEPYWWPTAHEGINSKQWTWVAMNTTSIAIFRTFRKTEPILLISAVCTNLELCVELSPRARLNGSPI